MPARLAYSFFYTECTRNLKDDARLEVDALLGDDQAVTELQERRMSAFAAMGAEGP
jgi:hypothetical protein